MRDISAVDIGKLWGLFWQSTILTS